MTQTFLLFTVVFIALVTDLKERRIPNWLTFSGAGLGLLLNIVFYGWNGLTNSLLGGVVGLLLLLIPFIMGGIGAGDVKLLGAIGFITSMNFVLLTMLWTAIAGGIIALAYMLYKKQLLIRWLKTGVASGTTFPYGIAIFLGTVIQVIYSLGWVKL